MEYWLPYRPQYPFDHSKEYLARLLAKLLALSLCHRSYHENLRFPSRCLPEAQPPPYPFWPRYNVKPLDHHRPSNRSYLDLLPRCSASSKAAPSSPSRHKLKSHRVGDIYPLLHQRYVLTSLSHVAHANRFYTLHIEYGDALASDRHAHLVRHGQ